MILGQELSKKNVLDSSPADIFWIAAFLVNFASPFITSPGSGKTV